MRTILLITALFAGLAVAYASPETILVQGDEDIPLDELVDAIKKALEENGLYSADTLNEDDSVEVDEKQGDTPEDEPEESEEKKPFLEDELEDEPKESGSEKDSEEAETKFNDDQSVEGGDGNGDDDGAGSEEGFKKSAKEEIQKDEEVNRDEICMPRMCPRMYVPLCVDVDGVKKTFSSLCEFSNMARCESLVRARTGRPSHNYRVLSTGPCIIIDEENLPK